MVYTYPYPYKCDKKSTHIEEQVKFSRNLKS
jgi:hypothetical protein